MVAINASIRAIEEFKSSNEIDYINILSTIKSIIYESEEYIKIIDEKIDFLNSKLASLYSLQGDLKIKQTKYEEEIKESERQREEIIRNIERIQNNPITVTRTDEEGNTYTTEVIDEASLNIELRKLEEINKTYMLYKDKLDNVKDISEQTKGFEEYLNKLSNANKKIKSIIEENIKKIRMLEDSVYAEINNNNVSIIKVIETLHEYVACMEIYMPSEANISTSIGNGVSGGINITNNSTKGWEASGGFNSTNVLSNEKVTASINATDGITGKEVVIENSVSISYTSGKTINREDTSFNKNSKSTQEISTKGKKSIIKATTKSIANLIIGLAISLGSGAREITDRQITYDSITTQISQEYNSVRENKDIYGDNNQNQYQVISEMIESENAGEFVVQSLIEGLMPSDDNYFELLKKRREERLKIITKIRVAQEIIKNRKNTVEGTKAASTRLQEKAKLYKKK